MRFAQVAAAVLACCTFHSAAADDVATIRERMLELYGWPKPLTPETIANLSSSALSLASRLLPNGTWPDVNYNDSNDRTIWATSQHMNRVSLMAAALSVQQSPVYDNDALFNSTRLALLTAYQQDWQNSNWWWDIIFMPQIHSISFLMLDLLPKDVPNRPAFPSEFELSKALEFTFRAAWWNASLGYEVTAANLAWMVQAQLLRGVWPSLLNESAVVGGFNRLWQEANIVPWQGSNGDNQGIQHDFSYHMHGPQLQTAAYGQDFLNDLTTFNYIANGTQWSMPEQASSVLCAWVAEGMSWTAVGPGLDWVTGGRQMDRNSWAAESKVIQNTTLIRILADSCNSTYASSVVSFADSVDMVPGTADLVGHRHYWTSDHAIHRRSGWAAMWHGHSNRTLPNECGNGENLLGVYEAQGVLNVYSTACELGPNATATGAQPGPLGWGCGLEYATIFPLLDWYNINGATALVDEPLLPNCTSQCCFTGIVHDDATSFVGGVSDGMYGASAMDTHYLSLTARKSTFFYDKLVLSMGTNISNSKVGRLRTALASRFLKAPQPAVTVGFGTSSQLLTDGNYTFNACSGNAADGADADSCISWAHADGVGWITAIGQQCAGSSSQVPALQLWAGYREEPWSSIGVYPGNMSGRSLSMSIQHGDGVDSKVDGECFAYAVVPNVTVAEMQAIVADPQGSLGLLLGSMINMPQIQAAAQVPPNSTTSQYYPQFVVEAVFWQPGSYLPGNGISITVDQPCILSYREDAIGNGGLNATIAVSNPDQPGLKVQVKIDNRASPYSPVPGQQDCPAGDGGDGLSLAFLLPGAGDENFLGQSVARTCVMQSA